MTLAHLCRSSHLLYLILVLQVFLQGSVDHEGNVSARMNQGWTEHSITKIQTQVRFLTRRRPRSFSRPHS